MQGCSHTRSLSLPLSLTHAHMYAIEISVAGRCRKGEKSLQVSAPGGKKIKSLQLAAKQKLRESSIHPRGTTMLPAILGVDAFQAPKAKAEAVYPEHHSLQIDGANILGHSASRKHPSL